MEPIILREAWTISELGIEKLCVELQELAYKRAQGTSDTVNMPEHRAAQVIRILMKEISNGRTN